MKKKIAFDQALDKKLQDLAPTDCICPVTFEKYSPISPPYILPCNHHCSYQALEKLEIFEAYDRQNNFIGSYMLCPLCLKPFLTAQLDLRYLDLIGIKDEAHFAVMGRQNGDEGVDTQKLRPLNRPYTGTFPSLFQPRGGVLLTLLEKIGNIHKQGKEFQL